MEKFKRQHFNSLAKCLFLSILFSQWHRTRLLELDAQTSYDFSKIKIKLGATNLLNQYYYSMLGGAHTGGFYYTSMTYDF